MKWSCSHCNAAGESSTEMAALVAALLHQKEAHNA